MTSIPVSFFEDGVEAFLFTPDLPGLRQTILTILTDFQCQLQSLNVVFVNDEELRTINKNFLQHDYYTDIITFDLSEKADVIEGELYISLERVVANAQSHQVEVTNELSRVVIHGVLHLAGLSDKEESQAVEMRKLESYYLNHLNVN